MKIFVNTLIVLFAVLTFLIVITIIKKYLDKLTKNKDKIVAEASTESTENAKLKNKNLPSTPDVQMKRMKASIL